MRQLNVDPEFRDKIPPLSADEFSKLEENIVTDGEVREPLVVWHNTIIDGHHRYKIVQKHPEIPFKVKKIILTVHRPEPSFCGVVKLDRQAEALVKQLQRETGMTAKYIVSQIIIQGFDLVEIKEDKE